MNRKFIQALYFLSGLTCNEDNFMVKSGAIPIAAKKNMILIAPDTSPRGCNIQGEDESWDLGVGQVIQSVQTFDVFIHSAAYYLDATENKWSNNYRMYTYITKELPQILFADFPIVSIHINAQLTVLGSRKGFNLWSFCWWTWRVDNIPKEPTNV